MSIRRIFLAWSLGSATAFASYLERDDVLAFMQQLAARGDASGTTATSWPA